MRQLAALVVGSLIAACGGAVPVGAAYPELPPGPAPTPTAEMRVHLIDVGQGAATLVEFSCGVVLVDTGGELDSSYDSTAALTRYLDRFFRIHKRLNNTIALLVLTHPHIDHTRGAPTVFERYHVQNVVTDGLLEGSGGEPQAQLISDAARAKIGNEKIDSQRVPATGLHDRVIDPLSCADGDPDIRAFWGAYTSGGPGDNENNDSVVMRFRLGKASFLVTGDLEQEGIGEVLKRSASELQSDVWEVGHHGSYNATTQPLLDAIRPKIALIEMGPPDRQETWSAWAYGHPRIESIELLEHALTGPPRPPIAVEVGLEHKSFQPRTITAPIYASGWDGEVTVTMHADGTTTVRVPESAANVSQP